MNISFYVEIASIKINIDVNNAIVFEDRLYYAFRCVILIEL